MALARLKMTEQAHSPSCTSPNRVVVFDLDDTLYLERDFCRSGFAAAEAWLAERQDSRGLAAAAMALLEAGHRGRIFDLALPMIGAVPSGELVQALVAVYRGHAPQIALAPDAAALLAAPPPGWAWALLSDGPAAVQRRKIAALGLDRYALAPMVCTDEFGRAFWKPHPRGYERIERTFGLPGPRFAYVADNPAKDFVTPRRRGWLAIEIRRDGRIHADARPAPGGEADVVITSLGELAALPRLAA